MLNIVIPMAGRGKRFAQVGYAEPKPLIPIHGVPMIEVVINNLRPSYPHRFIFLCLSEHLENYGLAEKLRGWAGDCEIITVDQVTEGAACTVLLARELIDSDKPLMIANCDQHVNTNINKYLAAQDGYDGLIMTMKADDPKWSFIKYDEQGNAIGVVEKEVVSNDATVGIYNFMRGSSFVAGADAMIAKNLRVNGEFYVAPVYTEMVAAGEQITAYDVGDAMHGLGVPEDLKAFLDSPVSLSVKNQDAQAYRTELT